MCRKSTYACGRPNVHVMSRRSAKIVGRASGFVAEVARVDQVSQLAVSGADEMLRLASQAVQAGANPGF
jgi:hypothetical protein